MEPPLPPPSPPSAHFHHFGALGSVASTQLDMSTASVASTQLDAGPRERRAFVDNEMERLIQLGSDDDFAERRRRAIVTMNEVKDAQHELGVRYQLEAMRNAATAAPADAASAGGAAVAVAL